MSNKGFIDQFHSNTKHASVTHEEPNDNKVPTLNSTAIEKRIRAVGNARNQSIRQIHSNQDIYTRQEDEKQQEPIISAIYPNESQKSHKISNNRSRSQHHSRIHSNNDEESYFKENQGFDHTDDLHLPQGAYQEINLQNDIESSPEKEEDPNDIPEEFERMTEEYHSIHEEQPKEIEDVHAGKDEENHFDYRINLNEDLERPEMIEEKSPISNQELLSHKSSNFK